MLWALGIAIWRRPGAFVADKRRCPVKVQVPAPGFALDPLLAPRYRAGGQGPYLRATLVNPEGSRQSGYSIVRGSRTTKRHYVASLAAQGGHLDIVRALADAGAQLDLHVDPFQATALIAAASTGHVAVFKLLVGTIVDRGADQT